MGGATWRLVVVWRGARDLFHVFFHISFFFFFLLFLFIVVTGNVYLSVFYRGVPNTCRFALGSGVSPARTSYIGWRVLDINELSREILTRNSGKVNASLIRS